MKKKVLLNFVYTLLLWQLTLKWQRGEVGSKWALMRASSCQTFSWIWGLPCCWFCKPKLVCWFCVPNPVCCVLVSDPNPPNAGFTVWLPDALVVVLNEPKPPNPVLPVAPVPKPLVLLLVVSWFVPKPKPLVEVAGAVCPNPATGADEFAPNVLVAADFWPNPPKPF